MAVGFIAYGTACMIVNRREREARSRLRKYKEERERKKKLKAKRTILSPDQRRLLASLQTQLSSTKPTPSTRLCPECRRPMQLICLKGVKIESCTFCRGCWFDPGELKYFTGKLNDIPGRALRARPSRFRCPVCQARMQERVFHRRNNLLVDHCPAGHGVYLEQHELERVFNIHQTRQTVLR